MVQKLRPWKTIILLNFDCDRPLYRQIVDAITTEIKKGRLKPGMALPGTRQLSGDLQVNRKTIVLAFDDLIAEGWLTTIAKKGTFVSDKLPHVPILHRRSVAETPAATFVFKSATPVGDPFIHSSKKTLVFDDGLPDIRLAPLSELLKSYKRTFQQNTRWRMMGYADPKGTEAARTAIAEMLQHDRGLTISTESICITRGSQMALYLTAQTFISKGDTVVVETPGYAPAWETFRLCGARLLPAIVDEEGICLENLEKICLRTKIKAVYVTPHHQFPTTVTMKMHRRLKLIELSNTYGFAIIEDDYDHEFHFSSRSMLPLASHQNAGNVIYISSLSKLVAPAVRIGYIAGPRAFVDSLSALRKLIDVQGDSVMEHAIAELMKHGELRKHARRAYLVYKQRWENMERALTEHLAQKVTFVKPEGGLAYWVKLNKAVNTLQLKERLIKKGVSIIPTEPFSFSGERLNALRLGYASLNDNEIERALKILSAVI